jgi:hypothetical protein
MAKRKCKWCAKVLEQADLALNDRRYKDYLRRYPDADISDNFGDRPDFDALCGTCVANHLQKEADRRQKETFLEALAQGDRHPDFQRNFILFSIIIFLLLSLLIGRQ